MVNPATNTGHQKRAHTHAGSYVFVFDATRERNTAGFARRRRTVEVLVLLPVVGPLDTAALQLKHSKGKVVLKESNHWHVISGSEITSAWRIFGNKYDCCTYTSNSTAAKLDT